MEHPSGPETASGAQRIAAEPLQRFTAQIFEAFGLSAEDAEICAQTLVLADLRGVWSHGVARTPMYCGRIRAGVAKAAPEMTVTRAAPAAALLDADDGLGLVAARRAVREAVAVSGETGVALVGVKRSGHFGMAAAHALEAIEAGRMVWIFTNASRALPPWGAAAAFFGTSPFCYGAPTAPGEPPFLIDMAMSVAARGKLKFAAQRGEPIPEGLALDSEGRPTTDGEAAFNGVMLPFGGVKGAAMSWMMDVAGGVFTGAEHAGRVANPFQGLDRPQNVGHLVICARADLFQPLESFTDRMTDTATTAKALPKAQGVQEILTPGENEARKTAENAKEGVWLTPDVMGDLKALAEEKGVGWPF